MTAPRVRGQVWAHVDMDGLDAIYQCHGRSFTGQDTWYGRAVDQSLAFFEAEGITATYFVIASDLDDPAKRPAIDRVVAAGHEIACHSLHHKYLDRISSREKREEIADAKAKIEQTLSRGCHGFRAPGYSVDFESLEIMRDAGFRYDTSVFPTYAFRKRLGIQRLFPEPFALWPEQPFFEIPMPTAGPFFPPFHPCYAFYLRRGYFNRRVRSFARQYNYLTLLFHLTDFAPRERLGQGARIAVFTNNFFSAPAKQRFLSRLVGEVRRHFEFTTTEAFLEEWPASAPDLQPRTILGLATTHETGACIVRDGRVLSAISEERLTRRKLDTRYPPVASIRDAIETAGVDPQEIDAVAVAGLHWTDLLPQSLESLKEDVRDFHAVNDYVPHFCRILYRLYYFWRALSYGRVRAFLKREYGIEPKIYYVEHHEAHAASVYRTGEWDDALIVTADGVGDDVAITFSVGRGSMIRREEAFFYPHSFGQFYTACTQMLGFQGGRHEGKITGLSGFGRADANLIDKVERTLFNRGGFKLHKRYYAEGFVRASPVKMFKLLRGKSDMLEIEYRNYKPPLKRLLRGHSREDVAYAFQFLLEREMGRLTARHWNGRTGNLALAGGVFANVKLNMALSQHLQPEALYIFPNMGDGGLGVGAALSVLATPPRPLREAYLGPTFGADTIEDTLRNNPDVRAERPTDLAAAAAESLRDGKIVARCDGRMEFGPRALGNRSILYHCGDPAVNDWLNKRLHRTEFMPFAPMCLYEDARDYFIVRDGELRPCEYMTLVVDCTDKMKETCPAAVHVDGTARPQLVRRETNPEMYAILVAYKRLTGISCIINTSFNMHEEPIVRTPQEAITAFRQSELDRLILGPFFVSQG